MHHKFLIKRTFDLILGAILLLIFSPVMLIIAVLIFFTSGRPIFFVQARPGYQGNLFNIYKFRTMRPSLNDSDSDAMRTTKLGAILRSMSLDELPELINVLRGEMSLVGPRPLLVEYLEHYSEEQKKRHSVRPGITGWAQVNGRNTLSWDRQFEYDLWYIKHWSILLDLKILLLTLKKVLLQSDVNQAKNITRDKFKGE